MKDNELIAEFMGFTFDGKVWTAWRAETPFECKHPFVVSRDGNTEYNVLLFDTSWDWLMPVVEKISTFVYEEHKSNNGYKDITEFDCAYPRTFAMPSSNGFMVRINRMTLHESFSLIGATYQAVLEFIKWHNDQSASRG